MDLNQLASDLFGSKRAESMTTPSTISVMYGIATSDSADGAVSVWLSDNALSPSDALSEWESVDSYAADAYDGMGESTSIEIPTEVTCFEGDVVRVQLTGAGAAKNPTVVGVVGRGDEQNERLATIEADYVKTNELEADVARIGFLKADSAVIGDIKADTAKVHDLTADQLSAATGFIADLTAGEVTAESIIADKAKLAQVDTEQLTADHAVIEQLDATYATVGNLNAATARIGDIEADYLKAADMEAEQARVGQLVAGKADIADLTAANGRIDNLQSTKADISVLESDYITADAIDATYMHANMSNSDVAWIQNGVIKDGSISNAMINDVSANKLTAGTINGEVINVTNLNASNITTGTINGQRIGEGSLSLDKLSEDVYTEQEVDSKLATMQAEIDGAIETWTGTAVPTLQNAPAVNWNTNAIKDTHVGDVYFVVNSNSQQNGYNYRFTKSGSTYSWQLIKDSDVTNALQRISTAEGKITTFDSDISTLKTDTGTLKTKTTNLETRMSDAEDDILDKVDTTTFNEVSDTVDQHSQTITQMSQTLSNKADGSTVTSLTQRVSKNEQDISGINTTIGELSTTVESKADSSTVETVSSRLNTVSNTVDGHTQSITNITSTQTTMQGKLDKTIVETTQLWYTKANTTAPSKPTSQVTSTSTSGGAWRTVVPAYSSSYPNYFYCYQWKYSDGTYGWSSVTRDIAMGESQSTSRTAASDASTAKTDAATAVSTANTANTNASDALTKANTADTNASTALSTANTAASDASTAKTDAASAVSTANTASSNASTAVSTANTAKATADKNVKSTVQLWYTKANETAPSKPTSKVTSTAVSGNGWRTVVPTYSSSYPYYYYCYQYELADGTYTWSDVVYDRATTENQSNSRSAVSGVSTLTTKTNTISDTVDGHTSQLTSITETQTSIQGSAVKSTVQLWFTKANTTAPNKPTAHVTTNSASTANAWNLAVPTYNSSYPYYYYCYEHQLLNDTYTWSAVTRDIATEENQSTSRSAKATADKNLKESQQLWFTKANSTAPSKPTSKVTSTAATGNAWTTRVPTYNDSYKYYFYCMQYVAADGTVTWSDVVYDQATTEAQSVARVASADLTEFHQDYATFKQTTTQFESTVGETYATKTELQTTDGNVSSLTTRVSTAETNIQQNSESIRISAKKAETIDGNMLYDVDASSLTKVYGPANRYFSDSGNASFMVCDIRAISDAPAAGIEYMAHWSVSGSTANKQRGLCFYNGNYIQFVAGQQYTLSCWVRCTSGKFLFLHNAYNNAFPASSGARTIDSAEDSGWQFVTTTVTATRTQLDRVYFVARTLEDSLAFECDMCGFKMTVAAYATQAELKVASDEISSKVSKDGVISSINQSAETVKIQASRVEIDGTAVFSAISSDVDDAITSKGYQTASQVNTAITSKGYATTTQAQDYATTAINNLQVGGRNLFGYGSECESLAGFTLSGTWDIVTKDGFTCAHASGALKTTKYLLSKIPFKPKPEEYVTLSAYIQINNIVQGTTNPMCEFYPSGQTINGTWRAPSIKAIYIDGTKKESVSSGRFHNNITDANWHHFAVVYQWPNYEFTANLMPSVYLRDCTGDLYVHHIKYERGNKATDWTPAPEDLQSNAVKRTQRIWYRKSAAGAPATPGTASSNWVVKADDGSNAWTKMHIAISSTEKFIYTCEQYEMGDGTVGYTSVLLDNTITVIDGGNIITGSVTAIKLNASDINASKKLTVGAMTDAAASTILNSNVQVGGRNLARNTADFSGWGRENTVWTFSDGVATFTPPSTRSWKQLGQIPGAPLSLFDFDATYVISFDAMLVSGTIASGDSLSPCVALRDTADTNSRRRYRSWNIISSLTSEWQRITKVIDPLPISSWSGTASSEAYFGVDFWLYTATATIAIRNAKLEKGNKATDWTPAPEDVDESILSVSKDINDQIEPINEGITTLTNDVTEHENRLTTNEQAIANVQNMVNNLASTTSWLSFTAEQGLIIGDSSSGDSYFYTQQKGSFMSFNQMSASGSTELMRLSGENGIEGPKVTVNEVNTDTVTIGDDWSITVSGDMFSINYIGS